MKFRLKNLVSLMLCASLTLSAAPVSGAAQAEKRYDIYPVVRQIDYDGTEFRLEDRVNVVYESGIDDATKGYLEEVLEERGIAAAVTGVLYSLWAGKGKLSCYFFGIFNSFAYGLISYQGARGRQEYYVRSTAWRNA